MTSGVALALAQQSCTFCWGLGLRAGRGAAQRPCNCVWRAVYRACFSKLRSIVSSDRYQCGAMAQRSTYAYMSGATGASRQVKQPNQRIRIREEYVADFCLLARRTLRDAGALANKIFRFHILLGVEQPLFCRRFGVAEGAFWHELYRVQQALGRAFFETAPYGLYPIDEYFSGPVRRTPAEGAATPDSLGRLLPIVRSGRPLRAPLARAAA
jgi:hypothetical protein